MAQGLFITGTDTGCGKTEVTLGLMHQLQSAGLRVAGMKPVASGAESTPAGLRNEDAQRIRRQAGFAIAYEQVNPYAYAPPIAPHLAAAQANRPVDLEQIRAQFDRLAAASDRVVVEGVGGWRVPLGEGIGVPDLVQRLELPVILVVGLRLGCINHALLSEESILGSGRRLLGWIGNAIDPAMAAQAETVRALRERLQTPCLGELPWLEKPAAAEMAVHLKMRSIEEALENAGPRGT